MPLRILIFEGAFLYFCSLENSKIKRNMGIFLTSMLSSIMVILAVMQILSNRYGKTPVEDGQKIMPQIILVTAVSLLCNLSAGISAVWSVPVYLVLSLTALYPLTSSVIPFEWAKTAVAVSMSLELLTVVFTICNRLLLHLQIGACLWAYLCCALCCICVSIFLVGIYIRLLDMKFIMRAGSVWSMVTFSVDTVYAILLMILAVTVPVFNVYVISVMMMSVIVALCLRIRNSSVFVLMSDHERRIVESMKVSQVEFSGESPGTDQLYSNIYERLLRYFEVHKPYLNSELTINDIVEVVFTNKLYISKAISHCTGRNFCQFVNYYRITHAVELFRKNPQLKVVELTSLSGFNSTTSFSAAFRLYMGEKPGDWCRMERVRLLKK